MYNWDDLKVFLEVSKTLNLSRAAKTLDVDQTTVYRRLLRFEKNLGRKLLKKTGQTYMLTSWGEGLVRKSAHFMDEMSQIELFLEDDMSELLGTVNITNTNVIANAVLPPLLAKFHKQYPQLQLEITVCEEFFDMYKREADLAIRSSDTVEPHEYAQRVGKGSWALYGTKEYLKDRPGINSPNFFSDNKFILGSDKIAHIKSTKWLSSKIREENIVLKASSMENIYHAVRLGMGIGLLPCVYKRNDKTLVELSEPNQDMGSPIWLITQKDAVTNEKIRICLDFFHRELRKIFPN